MKITTVAEFRNSSWYDTFGDDRIDFTEKHLALNGEMPGINDYNDDAGIRMGHDSQDSEKFINFQTTVAIKKRIEEQIKKEED